ncbi:MAG: NHLP bacteriocin export ABC transporter permease/ATPase subunit, partial [Cyanobacteria bacterium J06623_4]
MFRLEKPNQMWQIESGSVGIFAVTWQAGEPTGPRRYLFTVQAGEPMLGCRPATYGLVAIAFEPTSLSALPFQSPCQSDLRAIAPKLSTWFDHFSHIEGFPPPLISIEADPAHYISLRQAEGYQPKAQMSWISLQNGQAR